MKKFYVSYVYENVEDKCNTFNGVFIEEEEDDIRTESNMHKLMDALHDRHTYVAGCLTILNIIELNS